MESIFRVREYKALFYRLFLVYLFYFIARVLFLFFNYSFLGVETTYEFFRLYYYGLAFDTTAILYVNSLFILFSLLPLRFSKTNTYQRLLFYVYFISNLIAYSLNFVDFIYYKYNFSRTTISVINVLKDENNVAGMLLRFLITYWYVFFLFILVSFFWIYLYKRYDVLRKTVVINPTYYYATSILMIFLITI